MERTAALLTAALTFALAAGPGEAGAFDRSDLGEIGDHIFSGGPPRDGIPAMNNPQIVAPDQVSYVAESDLVLGVYVNGIARAYPENLGWWHEIINDDIGGQFISVTFCPLTGTGLVFNTTDGIGRQFEFGVSGLLANSNLIMYDRRDFETLYPQMIYTGISGSRRNQRLELLPVVETTWEMWKRMHPDTEVIQEGTGLDRYPQAQASLYTLDRYLRYPYGDYRTNGNNLFLFSNPTSFPNLASYGSKDLIVGLCFDGQAKSYFFKEFPTNAVINDVVGEQAVLLVYDEHSRTAIPYDPVVEEEALTFFAVESFDDMPQFVDVETRSRWNFLGTAVDGPLAGAQLAQLSGFNSWWFAWDSYYNDSPVWDGEGIIAAPVTAVEEDPDSAFPASFSLAQNFPNPLNPSTIIRFALPSDGETRLRIYNTAGQVIQSLVEGHQQAGTYMVKWDGRDATGAEVASGAYLYRLEVPATGLSETKTMTLAR